MLMAARIPADGKRGSEPAGVRYATPAGATHFGVYVEAVQTGDLLFISGGMVRHRGYEVRAARL
jgi:hypothetical protein